MTTTRSTLDACALLDADHRRVKAMFKDVEALTKPRPASTSQRKRDLADQICLELTVHAQIGQAADVDDKSDPKVTLLGEYIDHHIKEERAEIFVKARAARKLDLVGMRETLAARKEELVADPAVAVA